VSDTSARLLFSPPTSQPQLQPVMTVWTCKTRLMEGEINDDVKRSTCTLRRVCCLSKLPKLHCHRLQPRPACVYPGYRSFADGRTRRLTSRDLKVSRDSILSDTRPDSMPTERHLVTWYTARLQQHSRTSNRHS
jgi:hypothetical protein